MTSRRAWWLIMAVGLVTMVIATAASDASAASKSKRARHISPRHIAPRQIAPMAGAASSCRGASRFPCGPVYNGTDYLGADPDPFIRLMIQRDLGAKYGGES